MKWYLVIYHSTKKIECITILGWISVLFIVHLTSKLVSTFSCTFNCDFTPINVFLHDEKGLGKKYKKGWHYDKILVHFKEFKPPSFLSTSTVAFISSHLSGDSTLRGGGGEMLSHCIVFQGCPCLNFNYGNIGTCFSKKFA